MQARLHNCCQRSTSFVSFSNGLYVVFDLSKPPSSFSPLPPPQFALRPLSLFFLFSLSCLRRWRRRPLKTSLAISELENENSIEKRLGILPSLSCKIVEEEGREEHSVRERLFCSLLHITYNPTLIALISNRLLGEKIPNPFSF